MKIFILTLIVATGCGIGAPLGGVRIFVTRSSYPGNFGGLEAADQYCATAAADAQLIGMWRAWLSTENVNAIDRITGNGPWRLLDGTPVFANRAALAGSSLVPISMNELKQYESGGVWTGTKTSGRTAGRGHTCSDWTTAQQNFSGLNGYAGINDSWSENQDEDCSNTARLYCLEQ